MIYQPSQEFKNLGQIQTSDSRGVKFSAEEYVQYSESIVGVTDFREVCQFFYWANKTNLPRKPGVYFVMQPNGKPFYIGSSMNVGDRVQKHNKKHHFGVCNPTGLYFWPLEGLKRKEVLAVERFFIRKYKPPFNVAENSECREKHCQELQMHSELHRINEARLCLQDERNKLSRSRVLIGDEVISAVSTGMSIYRMTCYNPKGIDGSPIFVVGAMNARYVQNAIFNLTGVTVGMESVETPQDFRQCASDLEKEFKEFYNSREPVQWQCCSPNLMASIFEEAALIKESILSGNQMRPSQMINIGSLSFEEVQKRLAMVEPFDEPLSKRSHYSNQYPRRIALKPSSTHLA
jgi:hypothetical protein